MTKNSRVSVISVKKNPKNKQSATNLKTVRSRQLQTKQPNQSKRKVEPKNIRGKASPKDENIFNRNEQNKGYQKEHKKHFPRAIVSNSLILFLIISTVFVLSNIITIGW